MFRAAVGAARASAAAISVVAAVAIVIAALIYVTAGALPGDVARAFYQGGFGSVPVAAQTLTSSVPLILVALGWIVTVRAGSVHIGFPGQILIGGLATTVVALELPPLPHVLHIVLALLAGIVGGGAFAGIAAYLWARRHVNAILSTLLLNLIAVQVVTWFVNGPLMESVGGQPQTDPLPASARWPIVPGVGQGALSWDVILIPLLVGAVVFLFARTTVGFRMRVVGANATAARLAGYSPTRIGVWAMIASGGFSGLAGACLLLAGQTPAMTPAFEAGVGFNGIAVALLAFNSPVGVVFSALLFGVVTGGSDAAQVQLNVPASIALVTQGLIILCLFVAAVVWSRRTRPDARGIDEYLIEHRDPLAAVTTGDG